MDAYEALVKDMQAILDKSEVWTVRVLGGNPQSIRTMICALAVNPSPIGTADRRALRDRLLRHAPLDVLHEALWIFAPQENTNTWEGIIFSPFERSLHATMKGESINSSGLPAELISRLAAVKLLDSGKGYVHD